MKNTHFMLAAIAAVTLGTSAYAAEKESYQGTTKIEKDADGNYNEKNKITQTNAAGTTTTSESEANVNIDANGNSDKSTTTKEVTDPKGLFNKKTVKTSSTETVKDGLVKTDQSVTVDGKTVESISKTTPKP